MDAPAPSWFSDLEMEDYNLFQEEWNMKLIDDYNFDEEFPLHETASALQGKETLHQQPLSFDNSNSSSSSSSPNTTQFYGLQNCTLNSPKQQEVVSASLPSQLGNKHFSVQNPNGSLKAQNLGTKNSLSNRWRSSALAQDLHIIAERKRRETISQSFIALSALVPGLKKMDKASVLGDTIKYVKELKERLAMLEEECKKTKAESVVVLNRTSEPFGDDDDDDSSSSDHERNTDATGGIANTESQLQVKARVSGQDVLIRIDCSKQKGILVKILSEIQSLHLFVVNNSSLPFGDSISMLAITIVARMDEGYNITTKELVRKLCVSVLKFMS